MIVTDILQYPIKGLSEESLTEVELNVTTGMHADRLFAITHGNSHFDHTNPEWVQRNNFAVIAKSPELGPIHCQFDQVNNILTLSHDGGIILQESVNSADMNDRLSTALSKVVKEDGQPGPYKLVTLGKTRLTDSPTQTVSIMNTKSLQALEETVGEPLSKRRFRGNIWFDGDHAWQEHDMVGKAIHIGGVKLFVRERIARCPAIDADPILGVRNLTVLKQLNQSFGHVDFGVLAEVELAGPVKTGDNIG